MKEILTNSSLSCFKQCPRKYQFQYVMDYIPVKKNKNLIFGEMFHYGVENIGNFDNIQDLINCVEKKFYEDNNEDEYMLAQILALVVGYSQIYKDEDKSILKKEYFFSAPLLNPKTGKPSKKFILNGKIDGAYEKKIKETKTTSEDISLESFFWDKLYLDSQVSTYVWGGWKNGINIEKCVYDVVRKPTIKPKQVGQKVDPENPKRKENPQEYMDRILESIKEKPEFYYARRDVTRTIQDIEEFLSDTFHVAQNIHDCKKKNFYPRYTNSCRTNFGYCEYLKVCGKQAELTDTTQYIKKEDKHPELKQENKTNEN